jgi:sensor histidine kinase YesM
MGAFLYRGVVAVSNDQPLELLALVLITTITGFSISLILSVIYRYLIRQRPLVTWGVTALVLIIAVIIHTSIDTWVQGIYYGVSRDTTFAQRFVGLSYLPMTLLGGWSALYYAINFFLTVEQQADRLERLEAQATAAQLAMLRYQLNPHFLFNTLNSISTLVLLKQTEPANAMLTRLSGFLRHTLIAEPGSQVTLAQEIETLQLYLDIERMRFEERLRTHFEIEDAALDAQLPSMLLQPLVENAIKYAVGPQEEGARISLTARVIGDRLRLTVEDTGPGAEEPLRLDTLDPAELRASNEAGRPVSTGVGLANIRNRLMQAYGDSQLFETRSEPGGGFTVLIEIPYTRAQAPEPAVATPRPPAPTQSDNIVPLNPPQRTIGTPA